MKVFKADLIHRAAAGFPFEPEPVVVAVTVAGFSQRTGLRSAAG
jgi:hypothetical protein